MPLQPEELEQRYRVGTLSSIYLVPEYVSPDQETSLLREILDGKAPWTAVSGRRLRSLGGAVSAKGGLIPAPMPNWLQTVVERISREAGPYGGPTANHVLLNVYAPGRGIMPHEDGPVYYPGAAILSLGAPAVIRFRAKQCDARTAAEARPERQPPPLVESVVLPPRSLLVFTGDAYTGCLHGIDGVEEEEEEVLDDSVVNLEQCRLAAGSTLARAGVRASLTVRRVLKVHRLGVTPASNAR
jgi:alkylated DNA repair protein alkB family protein 6